MFLPLTSCFSFFLFLLLGVLLQNTSSVADHRIRCQSKVQPEMLARVLGIEMHERSAYMASQHSKCE